MFTNLRCPEAADMTHEERIRKSEENTLGPQLTYLCNSYRYPVTPGQRDAGLETLHGQISPLRFPKIL